MVVPQPQWDIVIDAEMSPVGAKVHLLPFPQSEGALCIYKLGKQTFQFPEEVLVYFIDATTIIECLHSCKYTPPTHAHYMYTCVHTHTHHAGRNQLPYSRNDNERGKISKNYN